MKYFPGAKDSGTDTKYWSCLQVHSLGWSCIHFYFLVVFWNWNTLQLCWSLMWLLKLWTYIFSIAKSFSIMFYSCTFLALFSVGWVQIFVFWWEKVESRHSSIIDCTRYTFVNLFSLDFWKIFLYLVRDFLQSLEVWRGTLIWSYLSRGGIDFWYLG